MGRHPGRELEPHVTLRKSLSALHPLRMGEVGTQRTCSPSGPKYTLRSFGCPRFCRRTAGPQLVMSLCFLLGLSPRPTPDIAWYKKGGDLPSDKAKFENFNKALRITNVSEEDSGEYFCLASNKMGSIRHTISVRVKGTLCVFLIMMVLPVLHATTTLPSGGRAG